MTRRPSTLAVFGLLTVFVAGGFRPAVAGNLPAGVELRAFLNDTCIVSDEPYYRPPLNVDQVSKVFPISAVIVGKLFEALVKGMVKVTASGLDNAAQHKDLHYVAAYDFDLYRASLVDSPAYALNDRLDCITVVAAGFEPEGSDCAPSYIPKQIPPDMALDGDLATGVVREDQSVENILKRANVCVEGEAHSVYEGRFNFSEDNTAFRIETAGLWVNSLISTKSRKAKRSVIYTFDIAEPGLGTKPNTLLSAAVPIGAIKAGTVVEDGTRLGRSDWLQVPSMSRRASQAYERDTAVHNDVYAEIRSLERSVTRNRRLLEGLQSRFADASESVQVTMLREMDGLEYKLLHMESLLDARKAEYEDLPVLDRYYMPVTVGVGVIESRSEKRAFRTLAAFLDEHRAKIATMASTAASNAAGYERSADLLGNDTVDDATLEQARSSYFDAVVAAEEARATGNPNIAEIEQGLARARDIYNDARAGAGIPAIN
jgi:hypothetical protein